MALVNVRLIFYKTVEPVYTSWLALIINLFSVKVSAKEIRSHVIHHLAAKRVSNLLSVVNACLTKLEMERGSSIKAAVVQVSENLARLNT